MSSRPTTSFDLRVRGGDPALPLLAGLDQAEAQAKVEGRTNVRTAAVQMGKQPHRRRGACRGAGPGRVARVKGYLANTDLFGIMMDALGLKAN